jgi:hypothetical protein
MQNEQQEIQILKNCSPVGPRLVHEVIARTQNFDKTLHPVRLTRGVMHPTRESKLPNPSL